MLIRPVTESDTEAVVDFAVSGMRTDLHPGLRLSRAKVAAVVGHFARSRSDFNRIALDDDGRVVGMLAALVTDMLWFERCEAHVVGCLATKPGAGRRMLLEFKAWADQDIRIRRVLWALDHHNDPRIERLAARYGFKPDSRTLVYTKH
jgi:hypothetical protein